MSNIREITQEERDEFFKSFVVALLWTETDENGTPLDDEGCGIEDVAENVLKGLRQDCDEFIDQNAQLLISVEQRGHSFARSGHDYCLSRNGHGAGFFERGLDEDGDALQEASQNSGQVDAYLGDDGKVYVMGFENFGQDKPRKPHKP